MNLLLLSVDSLRWDAVGRTHPHLLTTPKFDSVTADFVFTDRCLSVSTATRPVHQSVFSGLYPFEHGITGQHRRQRRRGIPRLMAELSHAGYHVGAFSEAASILGGVDIGTTVSDVSAYAPDGLAALRTWLRPGADQQALFMHYWSTHAPYGAADARALGETAELVRDGHIGLVEKRYLQAVEDCFELKIAPLLENLDMSRWTIVLFGDHGERWTAEELYHGQTLHHDVLRVPLFLHVPYQSARPGEICSLIDLAPTVRDVLQVPPVETFGRDLLRPVSEISPYLAQIEPTPHGLRDDEILSPASASGQSSTEVWWSVFDAAQKATIREPGGIWQRTTPFDPTAVPLESPPRFDATHVRRQLLAGSTYCRSGLEDGIDADVLGARLRDLGYLS